MTMKFYSIDLKTLNLTIISSEMVADFPTCKYTQPTSNKVMRNIVSMRIVTKSIPIFSKLSLIKREKIIIICILIIIKQLNKYEISRERFQDFRSSSPIHLNYLLSMSSMIDVQSHDIEFNSYHLSNLYEPINLIYSISLCEPIKLMH